MKTIKQLRLEILDWEKDNRTSKNRSISEGICLYMGPPTAIGGGCAIGRLVEDKSILWKWERKPVSAIFDSLPKSIKSLGVTFLKELQYLHDADPFWNTKGLSKVGIEKYQQIKDTFC